MSLHRAGSPPLLITTFAVMLCGACADNLPFAVAGGASATLAGAATPANQDASFLCHFANGRGVPIRVAKAAVAAHQAHGDYPAKLFVVHGAGSGDATTFATIAAAVAAARDIRLAHDERTASACRIEIIVGEGTFAENFPITIDIPDIDLTGAGPRTVLEPSAPLTTVEGAPTPLLMAIGHPDGSAANGLKIAGFVFRSGHPDNDPLAGGQGVFSMRVTGLRITGNQFDQGFAESIDLRASVAEVDHNQLGSGVANGAGSACDICLSGPGDFIIRGNALLSGGLVGINLSPVAILEIFPGVEQQAIPESATIAARIEGNIVVSHRRKPVGTAIRVNAVGLGANAVLGTSNVTLADNILTANTFGVVIDAGFPVSDGRPANVAVAFRGNTIASSCQNSVLVSFARHTTGLGLSGGPYLRDSRYDISLGGDLAWSDVWFSHRSGFGNELVVDGSLIPNGTRVFYNAALAC